MVDCYRCETVVSVLLTYVLARGSKHFLVYGRGWCERSPYGGICAMREKAIPVAQCCRVLGVSRSGFYKARRRASTPALCKATLHVRAAFAATHQNCGSRRLVTAPSNRSVSMGRYKVRRLVRQAGLRPVEAQVRAYDRQQA